MLVENIMKTDVVTLKPSATIAKALEQLNKYKIRHIPIVNDQEEVIGIVSDRDVRDASPSIFEKNLSTHPELQNELHTIMSSPVTTVHPLDFAEEIASIFYEKEFACVPVVHNKKLIGMITEKDMLYTLIQLTGTNAQGSHIEVKVPDRPGILPEVTAILGKRRMNIVSVLIYPCKDDDAYKILVFRIQTMNPLPVVDDLRNAGFTLLWPQPMQEPTS